MRVLCGLAVLLLASSTALQIPSVPRSSSLKSLSRRQLLAGGLAIAVVPSAAFAASGGTSGSKGKSGLDEKMDASVKAAKTPEDAKAQIIKGYNELGDLLRDIDAVTAEEGGDGIRRVLGTVGTTSAVYLIEPAFRLLFEADESLPMEYIEGVENIMLRLQSADGEAYSANFITFSSAKGKPEDFYGRAKNEIIAARKTWLELMTLLALKP